MSPPTLINWAERGYIPKAQGRKGDSIETILGFFKEFARIVANATHPGRGRPPNPFRQAADESEAKLLAIKVRDAERASDVSDGKLRPAVEFRSEADAYCGAIKEAVEEFSDMLMVKLGADDKLSALIKKGKEEILLRSAKALAQHIIKANNGRAH